MSMTTEDETPPGWHRLAKEAHHRTEGYWLASRGGVLIVASSVFADAYALVAGQPIDTYAWQRLASSTLITAFSFIQHRRWRARAAWLASTPRWWERDEEMPTILPFPRLSAWAIPRFQWANERLARSWLNRKLVATTERRGGSGGTP